MPQRNIPPPPFPYFLLQALLLINVVQRWMFSAYLPPPPPFPAWIAQFMMLVQFYLSIQSNLMQRLFPWYQPIRNQGRDVYSLLRRTPHKLWYLSGETVASFENIV